VYQRGAWRDLVVYGATCDEFGVPFKGVPRRWRL
jgi:hypothetical protein